MKRTKRTPEPKKPAPQAEKKAKVRRSNIEDRVGDPDDLDDDGSNDLLFDAHGRGIGGHGLVDPD